MFLSFIVWSVDSVGFEARKLCNVGAGNTIFTLDGEIFAERKKLTVKTRKHKLFIF